MDEEKGNKSNFDVREINLTNAPRPSGLLNRSQARKGMLLFVVLMFVMALLTDLSVALLSIPKFNELQTYEGKIKMTRGFRRGASLILSNKNKSILLNCWITSVGNKSCLRGKERNLYIGNTGKAWWYKARINGVFYEKRLLQLEVNSKIIITYSNQRKSYMRMKNSHFYVMTMVFFLSLFWLIIMYISNDYSE